MTTSILLASLVGLAPFTPAPEGCSQAHCDARLSDRAGLPAPTGGASIRWTDPAAAGSNYALGCASNGQRVACSFGLVLGGGPYLVVYDAQGQRLWAADELGPGAATSAPAIDAAGGVIAADREAIYRFDAEGRRQWRHALPRGSGLPISPVVTDSGLVAYATTGGRVGVVDSATGQGAQRALEARVQGVPGDFVTRNTPAARGDRVYVVAEFDPRRPSARDIGAPARLYALDLFPDRVEVAWFFEVGGRSGASPTVAGDVVYFDADQLTADGPVAPHFFAVRDQGDHGELVYAHPLTDPALAPAGTGGALASAAHDPRGGLWLFTAGSSRLVRLAEYPSAQGSTSLQGPVAEVLDDIDLSSVLGRQAQPSSAVTLAEGPSGGPVAMLTALSGLDTAWLVLDLERGVLLEDVPFGRGLTGWSAAQSPLLYEPASGRATAIVSTFADGVVAISAP